MKKLSYILIACIMMVFVDASGLFTYFQRSLIKIIMFGVIPF